MQFLLGLLRVFGHGFESGGLRVMNPDFSSWILVLAEARLRVHAGTLKLLQC